jgi:hypothetical protein
MNMQEPRHGPWDHSLALRLRPTGIGEVDRFIPSFAPTAESIGHNDAIVKK